MDDLERFLRALDEIPDDVLSVKYDSNSRNVRQKRRSQRKGRTGYDLTIDLHGFTGDAALERVKGILRDAKGRRMKILVITGRGNNSEGNVPVIRDTICQYLAGAGNLLSRITVLHQQGWR